MLTKNIVKSIGKYLDYGDLQNYSAVSKKTRFLVIPYYVKYTDSCIELRRYEYTFFLKNIHHSTFNTHIIVLSDILNTDDNIITALKILLTKYLTGKQVILFNGKVEKYYMRNNILNTSRIRETKCISNGRKRCNKEAIVMNSAKDLNSVRNDLEEISIVINYCVDEILNFSKFRFLTDLTIKNYSGRTINLKNNLFTKKSIICSNKC